MRSREEHLEWCKQRAREYLAVGDWQQAATSMASDLRKHPETDSKGTALAMLYFTVQDMASARRYIEGFN